jgi:cysteine desulfurase / selenocysteine lyase
MFDVNKIKEDFPILKREINGKPLVYLDSAATSQKPVQVLDAVDDYYRNHNANIHRGVHTLSIEATGMVDEARIKVAKFIGAESEKEVVFVRNTTEAINLVMYSWGKDNVKAGDVVVTSLMEHHSNMVPWQELTAEVGAELRVVGVDEMGRLDMNDLEKKLDGKVKLVAITAVSNVLGTIVPMEKVVRMVRNKSMGARILVDGAQLVPHMSVNVKKMGVDWLAFSGHKMMATTGTGVLWGRKELLSEMNPFLFGGDMIDEVKLDKSSWAEVPHKFEAGTLDIAGIIGLGAAVDYLSNLGMDEIRAHEKELTGYGLRKLEELEKLGIIEIYGPRDSEERGGVLTFNVVGIHAHDVAQVLDSFGIAVRSGQHCGAPIVESYGVPAMVRASMYVYNDKKQIDYLCEKIPEVLKVFQMG